MKLIRLLLAAVVVLLLVACGGGDPSTAEPVPEDGDPAAGRQVFNTGGASQIPCATCHTLDGTDLVGPSLQGIGDRAGTVIPDMSAADYLRQAIVDPSAHVVEGFADVMNKDYGERLSGQELDNLIAFLLTQ